MNKEKQIQDWLNGRMSADELKSFQKTDTYKSIQKIDHAAQFFKAPDYNISDSLNSIDLAKKEQNAKKSFSSFYKISAVAALFIIGLFIGFQWVNNSSTTIKTASNEQQSITLPDQSRVYLNANSTLSYSSQNFLSERSIQLEGEAFFVVQSGESFIVKTPASTVEVLGTSFNIKSRADFTEVDCYMGKVKVTDSQNNQAVLSQQQRFYSHNGNFETINFNKKDPGWVGNQRSSFHNTRLQVVLDELAAQYQIDVVANHIDLTTYYTGSFVHDNLEEALKSITLPLQINFTIHKNQVTLQKD